MSNHPPDYYAVLNVARTATQHEISRAYRALMRTHHPDVDGGTAAPVAGNADSEKEAGAGRKASTSGDLLSIMEAFAVLRDPNARAEYDRAEALHPASQDGPREVPVRRVRRQQPPLLRVTPVLWERGPWAGPR